MKRKKKGSTLMPRLEKAVALRYDQTADSAPKVVAKGQGTIAQQIRMIAEKLNIPLQKNDDLVELLSQVEIDAEIPPELYAAVAEIMSWLMAANAGLTKDMER